MTVQRRPFSTAPAIQGTAAHSAIGLALLAALGWPGLGFGRATEGQTLQAMPPALETRYALSALPPTLRDGASVYLLDPAKGYSLARRGDSGLACLVQRTDWALADYRDDIYFAICYDAAGVSTYMQAIMDAAALRAQGMAPAQLKQEMLERFRSKTYLPPAKPGVSYMVAPLMRTIGPPDLKVHTMAMPHLMFYAPGLTNSDIGARPDLKRPDTLSWPFIDTQGTPEHSYMIQMTGAAEKKQILDREKDLIRDLCSYRKVLCLTGPAGHAHR